MNTTLRMKVVLRPTAVAESADGAPSLRSLGGSTDPQEFLAMHRRQRQAQARRRLWKRTALVVGVVGLGASAIVWPLYRDRGQATAQAAATAAAAPVALASAAPLGTAAAADLPTAAANQALAPAADQPGAALVQAGIAQGTAPAADSTACDEAFAQLRWKAAIDSCGRAFEAGPGAALALKIAHSHWSSGLVREAGDWATKAVDLGTQDADAFVLIGHSERQAGRTKDAIAAYRKYLRSSPRGWHARQVRAALRDLKQQVLLSSG